MIIKSVDVYGEKFEGEIISVYKNSALSDVSIDGHLSSLSDDEWFVEFYLTRELMIKYNIKISDVRYSPNEVMTYVLPCTNVVIDES